MSNENKFLKGETLAFNKPVGWSSFNLVKKVKNIIKSKYNIKKIKVGHAGTLDPLASGLVVICTGKHTKKIGEIQAAEKVYVGEITLGKTTPSYDLETSFDRHYETSHINEKLILNSAKEFHGEIPQVPPLFSALKINGERLYKKARRGEKLKIPARKILIKSFEITDIKMPVINFKVTCGKGTYIRSLAHDFGKKLHSGAHLSKLCRERIGNYTLKNAYNIEDFQQELSSIVT